MRSGPFENSDSQAAGKPINRSWWVRPLAVCVVSIAVAFMTGTPAVWATDFDAADALMLRLMATNNVPGAALALIKDCRIVLEKGYGFRDLETHAPVTPATLFNIGSISKSFTALSIAVLTKSAGQRQKRKYGSEQGTAG